MYWIIYVYNYSFIYFYVATLKRRCLNNHLFIISHDLGDTHMSDYFVPHDVNLTEPQLLKRPCFSYCIPMSIKWIELIIQYLSTKNVSATTDFTDKFVQIFKGKITLISCKLFQTMEKGRTLHFLFIRLACLWQQTWQEWYKKEKL